MKKQYCVQSNFFFFLCILFLVLAKYWTVLPKKQRKKNSILICACEIGPEEFDNYDQSCISAHAAQVGLEGVVYVSRELSLLYSFSRANQLEIEFFMVERHQ